jgi:hypothetical protein
MRALVHEKMRRDIPLGDVGRLLCWIPSLLSSSKTMDTWLLLEEGQSEILLLRFLIEDAVVLSNVCARLSVSAVPLVCVGSVPSVLSFASQEVLPSSLVWCHTLRCLPSSSPGASAQWFCPGVLRCYLPTIRLVFLERVFDLRILRRRAVIFLWVSVPLFTSDAPSVRHSPPPTHPHLESALLKPAPHNLFFRAAHGLSHGMAYLHNRQIIHRDIKPSNVLIQGDYANGRFVVKLTDFGVARKTKDECRYNYTAETGTYRWMVNIL